MKFLFQSLMAALLLAGCSQSEEQAAPQEVPVRVVTVTEQTVPNVIELPGRAPR